MQIANCKLQIGDERPRYFAMAIAWLRDARWTIGLAAAMLLANWALFAGPYQATTRFLSGLEYDREAICHGELWRLVTGNLVHWSPEHLYLDVGAFLAIGLLYESVLKRSAISYSTFLLVVSLAIGGSLFVFLPDMNTYRGLSGVDSGLFAAALLVEAAHAKTDRRRWWWLAPATLVFGTKIGFECLTGELFFGTSSLADLGQPVPLAHAAGALAALAYVYSISGTDWWLGQKLAAVDDTIPTLTLSASDAPVVAPPGHRREKVGRPNPINGAALPQPPLAFSTFRPRLTEH